MRIFRNKVGSEFQVLCLIAATLTVTFTNPALGQASKPEFMMAPDGTIFQLQQKAGRVGYYSKSGQYALEGLLVPVPPAMESKARSDFPTRATIVPQTQPAVASGPNTPAAGEATAAHPNHLKLTPQELNGLHKSENSKLQGGKLIGIRDGKVVVVDAKTGEIEANDFINPNETARGAVERMAGSRTSDVGSGQPSDLTSGERVSNRSQSNTPSAPPEPTAKDLLLAERRERLEKGKAEIRLADERVAEKQAIYDGKKQEAIQALEQLGSDAENLRGAVQEEMAAATDLKAGNPPANRQRTFVELEPQSGTPDLLAAPEEAPPNMVQTPEGRSLEAAQKKSDEALAQANKSRDTAFKKIDDMQAADDRLTESLKTRDDIAKKHDLQGQENDLKEIDKLSATEIAEKQKVVRDYANGPNYDRISDKVKAKSQDRCAYGATVSEEKYGCGSTETIVEGAKIFNQTSQVLGSAATQVMGQSATQGAARENTQAGYLEAGAKVQENTGKMQVGIGAINALSGVFQIMKGSQHKKLAKEASAAGSGELTVTQKAATASDLASTGQSPGDSGYVSSSNAETQQFVTRFDLNKKGELKQLSPEEYSLVMTENLKQKAVANRNNGERRKVIHMEELLSEATTNAANEQAGISKEANAGGITSLMTGAGQLIQGAAAIASAKELKKAANTMRQPVGGSNFAMPNFGANPGGQTQGGAGGTVITGNGNPAVAEQNAAEEEAQDDAPTLGEGFLPNAPPGGVSGPPVAPRLADGSGGAGVSGSGSVGGGATGAGEEGAGEAPKAEYASNLRDPGSQFASGGGGYVGGGGGGGGDGGGPDLSGMLEKLLGKNGETEFRGKPSLDEFGRAPASEPYSFLDKSVNIFDRIHKAYQAKSKSGRVGI